METRCNEHRIYGLQVRLVRSSNGLCGLLAASMVNECLPTGPRLVSYFYFILLLLPVYTSGRHCETYLSMLVYKYYYFPLPDLRIPALLLVAHKKPVLSFRVHLLEPYTIRFVLHEEPCRRCSFRCRVECPC